MEQNQQRTPPTDEDLLRRAIAIVKLRGEDVTHFEAEVARVFERLKAAGEKRRAKRS